MFNGELKSPVVQDHGPPAGLNSETTIALSQSMDSVNTSPEEEVRTLFVSGLPMDAKPRELYLLFRSYKGYENALLKMMGKTTLGKNNNGYEGSLLKVTNKNGKNTSPVGFVTFNSRVAAETAKQDLQGVRFDPDLPQTLRLEFAKSNTKVTKPKQQSPQPATHPTLIHPITGQDLGAAFFPAAGPEAMVPTHALAYPELAPATALHHTALMQHPALAQLPVRAMDMNSLGLQAGSPLGYEFHPAMMHPASVTAALPHPSMGATQIFTNAFGGMPQMYAYEDSREKQEKRMRQDPRLTQVWDSFQQYDAVNGAASSPGIPGISQNSPCSTLFVANLGQFSSEQELKDLFSSFQGFCRLKMYNKGGSPVAFVEYQTGHKAQYDETGEQRVNVTNVLDEDTQEVDKVYNHNDTAECNALEVHIIDVKQAQDALGRLQGFVLLSSDRGGIRIEYAKHKMGEVVTV